MTVQLYFIPQKRENFTSIVFTIQKKFIIKNSKTGKTIENRKLSTNNKDAQTKFNVTMSLTFYCSKKKKQEKSDQRSTISLYIYSCCKIIYRKRDEGK